MAACLEAAWAWLRGVGQMLEPKSWIELGLSVVIGGATITVAVQQYRLAKARDRRELCDRQLATCDAVYAFLDSVSSSGRVDDGRLNALNKATEPLSVELLFRDAGARAKLAEIRDQAQRLWAVMAQEKIMPRERVGEYTSKREKLREWFEQERAGFKEYFGARLALRPGKVRHKEEGQA